MHVVPDRGVAFLMENPNIVLVKGETGGAGGLCGEVNLILYEGPESSIC